MPRITLGQQGKDLEESALPGGQRREGEGIPHDQMRECGSLQRTARVLEEYAAHLLDHAVEIDDALDPESRARRPGERFRIHAGALEFLPAAAVNEHPAVPRQGLPRRRERGDPVLPGHEGEAKEKDRPAAVRFYIALHGLKIETHVISIRVN